MHFRVDTKGLVRALKLVQPGLSSSHLSTSPYVVVNAQLGRIELSTWTGRERFVASVVGEVSEEGIVALDYQQLLDTVKPLNAMVAMGNEGANLTITVETEYRHQTVVQGYNPDTLPTAPGALPVPDETFQQKKYVDRTCEACHHSHSEEQVQTYRFLGNTIQPATLSKKRFLQMFDQVAWLCADWDYERQWLTGVCIELADERFSLVGARRLGGVLAGEPMSGTWKIPRVLVEAPVFRRTMKAVRHLPKDAKVTLEVVCTQFQLVSVGDEPVTDAPVHEKAVLLRLVSDGFEATLSVMWEKTPQHRKQFQREYATRVVCETTNLLNVLEMMYPAAQTYTDAVKITVEGEKLTVEVPDVSPVIGGEVPLTDVSGPEISVLVNASYLLPVLKKLSASQLSLEFSEQTQQPIVLRSCGTEEYTLLLQTMEPKVPA